jgi:tRNA(fMet)-specific endonuclease VapC
MRGWLSSLAKERRVHRQVTAYRELAALIDFFRGFYLIPFDTSAADLFESWNRIRISSTDRKIAAITIVRNSLLLSSNRRDYEQIPGLRFENWLHDAI